MRRGPSATTQTVTSDSVLPQGTLSLGFTLGMLREKEREKESTELTMCVLETESLNGAIMSEAIESVIKSLPAVESQGLNGFTGEFHETFKVESMSILSKLFQNLKRRKLSYLASIILIQSKKRTLREKINHRPVSLTNVDVKIFHKILAHQIQQHISGSLHHDRMGFIS